MRLLHWVISSVVLLSGGVSAQGTADSFPSRPVVMVVPFASGGPVDQETRLYGSVMTKLMGQPFIADFKPGAASTIGIAYVAKAAPDGHTVLMIGGGFTSTPALFNDLPYDPIKDFAPISNMSEQGLVLLVHPSFPAKSIVEYIAYARANPGKINFGTGGDGGIQHLVGAWLHSVTNTKVAFVSYKGSAPMILDIVAGRLDVIPTTVVAVLSQIKSGKLRALAISGDKRSNLLPDVPTVGEQGITGFSYTNWTGIVAPAATPAPIIRKLNEGFAKTAKAPEVAGPLEALGNVMLGSTPEQLRQHIVAQIAVWKKVVQDNGIKLEQ